MFSASDKAQQAAIAARLESTGYTTYLPQRDGIELGYLLPGVDRLLREGVIPSGITLRLRKLIFALDMYQLLERSQSVVLNMDGRTPDDGSLVEAAAAFAAGKPIVIYKSTPISMIAGLDNPMVQGLSSTWKYVYDVKALPAALAGAVDEAERTGPYTYSAPPDLAVLMEKGKSFSERLERAGVPGNRRQLTRWALTITRGLL